MWLHKAGVLALVMAAALLGGCSGGTGSQAVAGGLFGPCGLATDYGMPVWSPDGRHIAFVAYSYQDSIQALYVMNATGGSLTRLAETDFSSPPSWSPDGSRIVFVSGPGYPKKPELHVIGVDGSNETALSMDVPADNPVWSPGPDSAGFGDRIAFTSWQDNHADLYVVNPDGSGLTRLAAENGSAFQPSWSPDGRRIAFLSRPYESLGISVMDADGANQVRLADTFIYEFSGYLPPPAWSPDGKEIAFMAVHADVGGQIVVMDADGWNQRYVTNTPQGLSSHPLWSPDGKQIAYLLQAQGNTDIYVMNADGSHPVRLTVSPYLDVSPAWSPDGARIAYISEEANAEEIYSIEPDGSHKARLTSSPANQTCFRWSL